MHAEETTEFLQQVAEALTLQVVRHRRNDTAYAYCGQASGRVAMHVVSQGTPADRWVREPWPCIAHSAIIAHHTTCNRSKHSSACEQGLAGILRHRHGGYTLSLCSTMLHKV